MDRVKYGRDGDLFIAFRFLITETRRVESPWNVSTDLALYRSLRPLYRLAIGQEQTQRCVSARHSSRSCPPSITGNSPSAARAVARTARSVASELATVEPLKCGTKHVDGGIGELWSVHRNSKAKSKDYRNCLFPAERTACALARLTNNGPILPVR